MQVQPLPDQSMAIVDPAGYILLQEKGPYAAGGASAAIYDVAGIRSPGAQFPLELQEALKDTQTRCRYFYQGNQFESKPTPQNCEYRPTLKTYR